MDVCCSDRPSPSSVLPSNLYHTQIIPPPKIIKTPLASSSTLPRPFPSLSKPPPSQMSLPVRPPKFYSHRRILELHISSLHKCSNPNHVKQVHAQIYKFNLHTNLNIAQKLISSYSFSSLITHALKAFDQILEPNTCLYNALIRGLCCNSQHSRAFTVFLHMQECGLLADNFTYPFLLKACCGHMGLKKVQMVHTHVLKMGFLDDIFVPNSLIDSYSKNGSFGVVYARKLFDNMDTKDVVTWNSMVSGLIKNGEVSEARKLFDEMNEKDIVSWNTMLDGHSKAGEMEKAFELFQSMSERNVVSWSTIINGYCKSGEMDVARMLFDKMPIKNLVPWTIIISGYVQKGLANEACNLLDQMENSGLRPDGATVISILGACAESGLLGLGKRMHSYISTSTLRFKIEVSNALIDMYAKCGSLNKALSVFNEMREKDLVTWNSMMQGLANHGHGEEAIALFARMCKDNVRPDAVTFVAVLCACIHTGSVEEARMYFDIMEKEYEIVPEIEHYGCMIDILGRSGLLKEAFDLARRMPLDPNAIIWGSLLGACRLHNDVSLAEKAVDQLIKLEPSDSGNLTILSNIYAAAGKWDGKAKTRIQMKNVQKPVGSSWIEVDDSVHEFRVGDRNHPHSDRIINMVNRLGLHLKQEGCVQKSV